MTRFNLTDYSFRLDPSIPEYIFYNIRTAMIRF